MNTETLKVEGMSCGHCVNAVQAALNKIGVEAKVDLKNKNVVVEFDKITTPLDQIKKTIEDQGYDVL